MNNITTDVITSTTSTEEVKKVYYTASYSSFWKYKFFWPVENIEEFLWFCIIGDQAITVKKYIEYPSVFEEKSLIDINTIIEPVAQEIIEVEDEDKDDWFEFITI
jgi:hypothetical protein